MNLPQHLQRSLRALGIPARGTRVVVAVSGGADSVALLLALHRLAPKLGLELRVAHLHHGLRGGEADADARFVRALARRLGWPVRVGRADVRALARRDKLSVETAARQARYAFLVRTARAWPGAVIATAHTRNDQAETVLLRLARGAGLRGLAGIPPAREEQGLRVVRPLLDVSREEIEAFLVRAGQPWREDASNADRAPRRNRVRHDVLPLLAATLNPRIVATLARTAAVLRGELERREAQGAPVGRGECGPVVAPVRLRIPGETRVPALGCVVRTSAGDHVVRERGAVGMLPAQASLSRSRLGRRALAVRAWRPGDRLAPFGMAGSKKLQDIFTDAKVPADRRRQVPVLVCGDEIVWVAGYRVARAWAVPPGGRMLEIHIRGAG